MSANFQCSTEEIQSAARNGNTVYLFQVLDHILRREKLTLSYKDFMFMSQEKEMLMYFKNRNTRDYLFLLPTQDIIIPFKRGIRSNGAFLCSKDKEILQYHPASENPELGGYFYTGKRKPTGLFWSEIA